jgi:flagellar basal body rod protein FlgG
MATSTQNGKPIGRIQAGRLFEVPAALTKFGANYFSNTSGSGYQWTPLARRVYQGKIEASNVSASHGAVRIVGLTRQFEMMQKADLDFQ